MLIQYLQLKVENMINPFIVVGKKIQYYIKTCFLLLALMIEQTLQNKINQYGKQQNQRYFTLIVAIGSILFLYWRKNPFITVILVLHFFIIKVSYNISIMI